MRHQQKVMQYFKKSRTKIQGNYIYHILSRCKAVNGFSPRFLIWYFAIWLKFQKKLVHTLSAFSENLLKGKSLRMIFSKMFQRTQIIQLFQQTNVFIGSVLPYLQNQKSLPCLILFVRGKKSRYSTSCYKYLICLQY